jgi:1,4-dihydroxy-2-naphthoyl-CoA hydrolase
MQLPHEGDAAEVLNAHNDPFSRAQGMRYLSATAERVEAELVVTEAHHQAFGIVHGGVHAAMIETTCSAGAALAALRDGLTVVGLDNHTSFLRAVRGGALRIVATPLTRGRKSQLWEATVCDAEGRKVATGRVRLLCISPDTALGVGGARA